MVVDVVVIGCPATSGLPKNQVVERSEIRTRPERSDGKGRPASRALRDYAFLSLAKTALSL